jgi:sec-independent protein translocase protein TatA
MLGVIALLEGIGGPELLLIGLLALLMFGSKRLPELGRAFGRAVREFKRATSGVEENLREVMREEAGAPTIRTPARQVPARTTPAAPAPPPPAPPPEPAAGEGQPEAPSPDVIDRREQTD